MNKSVGRLLVMGALALLTAGIIFNQAHGGVGAQPSVPTLIPSGLPPDFQQTALGPPSASPNLMKTQAVALIKSTYWNLSGATNVTAQYTGWVSRGLMHRTAQGRLEPYGRQDVWRVTADMTTFDPGGGQACPPGSTAATCPSKRVYHHMVFIVDDKAKQVVEASPY